MEGHRNRGLFTLCLIIGFAASGCGSPMDLATSGLPAYPKEAGQSDPSRQRYMVKFNNWTHSGSAAWTNPSSAAFLTSPMKSVGTLGLAPTDYLQRQLGPDSYVDQIANDLYVMQAGDIQRTLGELQASPEVEYVEIDPIAYAVFTPNDPGYPQQWAHPVVKSPDAWNITQGSTSVLVGVIDTGMDYDHPDLKANVYSDPVDGSHGYNFVKNTSDPMADDAPTYHGTHVSGTIGASCGNGVGVCGHSPNVRMMALKFLSSSGSGNTSDAIRAIQYGIQKKVKILSNSWGSTQYSKALGDAIEAARQAGILFVVAAGNGGPDGRGMNNDQTPTYPASFASDNIIAVAATDQNDRLTTFSNYGATTVHIAAPGLDIYSTKNGGQYQTMSGTSMATPLVSGVAAMMIAARPDLTYREIKNAILSSADAVPALQGKVVSNGRVNAYRALQAISVPEPTPSPSPLPSPTPVPSPLPGKVANTPLLSGQGALYLRNPSQPFEVQFDVRSFSNAAGVYVEFSRTNASFSNPNGNTPDPRRLSYSLRQGKMGKVMIYPIRDLPGWGVYSIRVIPLDASYNAVGLFSSPAKLTLWPL